MAVDVILPRVDMDMRTARISRWLAADGDPVRKGSPLFEIETDKATMEIEAEADGVLRVSPGVQPGQDVPIGTVVAHILQGGEPPPASPALVLPPVSAAPATEPPAAAAEPVAEPARASQPPAAPPGQGIRATPLARRLARDLGVELATIRGRGPRGRISSEDVRSACEARFAAPTVQAPTVQAPPGSGAGLHVVRAGRHQAGAVPVVFLHGYGSEAAAWRPVWGALGPGRPMLAIDLPGHGKSPAASGTTLDGLADAVLATLRREGVEAAHLVGHSLGGAVAARLAEQDLLDARSLLLLAPAGLGPEINGAFIAGLLRARQEDSLLPWMERLVFDPAHVSRGMLRSVLEANADVGRLAFRKSLAEALFPDGTQAASLRTTLTGRVQTRVVWGRGDAVIPWRHALAVPGSVGLHLFDGMGHMPHIEAPAEVARLQRHLLCPTGSEQPGPEQPGPG